MLLSIIIPVYNVEEYLKQCLDSILKQSFQDYEIICIDDCSTDNSLAIIKEYEKKDSRIKVLHNEKNIGLGLTRNRGLEIAKGKYIHFVDSDDWLEEDAYAKVVSEYNKMEEKPEILFFRHYIFHCETSEKTKEEGYKNPKILNQMLNPQKDADVIANWDRYAWCKWHERKFLLKNNIWYNDYRFMEDVEQAAHVYVNCKKIYFLDIFVINYRIKRKGSLITNRKECLLHTIKSVINNRQLFENLAPEIKYRLLGFDYFLVKRQFIYFYNENFLSTMDLLRYIPKEDTNDVKKYIYDFMPSYMEDLTISPIKIILRKNFPALFYFIVGINKFLKRVLQK